MLCLRRPLSKTLDLRVSGTCPSPNRHHPRLAEFRIEQSQLNFLVYSVFFVEISWCRFLSI